MREEVVFKGSCSGLRVILANTVTYDKIKEMLRLKLESSRQFFKEGTVIALDADWLDEVQKQEMTHLFSEYGLVLTQVQRDAIKEDSSPEKSTPQEDMALSQEMADEVETMIINQNIRNGQEVIADGSIVINGNVNPGGTVIARGNIEVHGSCRGIVHAGAFGDENATVTAEHLIPIQIRIGTLVARSPQVNMSKEDAPYPEVARAKDGKIILEAVAERREDNE